MAAELDPIALSNFAVSTVTAACAIYIAYLALKHTARPRIGVLILDGLTAGCGEEFTLDCEIYNIGYWYGTPPAINIMIYFNYDPIFDLRELHYGSAQEITNTHVRVGKGGRKFLRANGIKLVHRDSAERAHVIAVAPDTPGEYRLEISAFSENGASLSREFKIECIKKFDSKPHYLRSDPERLGSE